MTHELGVFFATLRVGTLQRMHSGSLAFTYDRDWLNHPQRFAVSASLPLAADQNQIAAAAAFFGNLLPEGAVRDAIARRLQISPNNDFELLAAIGGECAGALSILPPDQTPTEQNDYQYEALAPEAVAQMAKRYSIFADVSERRGARLSLAGAQDKLPVRYDPDGTLWLSVQGAPSTHILKVPSRRFKHLPANEVLTTGLARSIGLPAVESQLVRFEDVDVAVITRYDRQRSGHTITRLHQEDVCQALGLMPSLKYEAEGGPRFAQVVRVIRAQSSTPLEDVRHLLSWMIFNVLVTNADGHGKNVSLLHHQKPQGCRLAPLYDLVCTSAYPGVDRHLAMRLGGESDPGKIGKSHWERLADEVGVGHRLVHDQVREMAQAIPDSFGLPRKAGQRSVQWIRADGEGIGLPRGRGRRSKRLEIHPHKSSGFCPNNRSAAVVPSSLVMK